LSLAVVLVALVTALAVVLVALKLLQLQFHLEQIIQLLLAAVVLPFLRPRAATDRHQVHSQFLQPAAVVELYPITLTQATQVDQAAVVLDFTAEQAVLELLAKVKTAEQVAAVA
jgi:hypothetical protein